ncbi:MAG: hypothetical protein GY870_02860 [archaeon]|nr:hypothetical protein [archaeon]
MKIENKFAVVLGIAGGICLYFAEVIGSAGYIGTFLGYISPLINNPTALTIIGYILDILYFLASWGGITVIGGSILMGIGQNRIGRFIIYLGMGTGLISFAIENITIFLQGNFTQDLMILLIQTPGWMGIALSILSREAAKTEIEARHKIALILGISGGAFLLIAGVIGSTGWMGTTLEILQSYISNPDILTAIENILDLLNYIASMGGISVIIGAILLSLDKQRFGKLVIGLGTGTSLISFIILNVTLFIQGALTTEFMLILIQTPGWAGVALSIVSIRAAKFEMRVDNKLAVTLGIAGGICLTVAGVIGSIGFMGYLLELIQPFITNPNLQISIEYTLKIMNYLASLGGISVIFGAILFASDKEKLGKRIMGIGMGSGLFSFLLENVTLYMQGALTQEVLFILVQTPGWIGMVLALLAMQVTDNN